MIDMKRRRTLWIGITVVVLVALVAVVAVVLLKGTPAIPHETGGEHAACTRCHTADRLPGDHSTRGDETCGSCHEEKAADAGAGGNSPGVAVRALP